MNLTKTEIIIGLNKLVLKYKNKIQDSFFLFDYKFDVKLTSHFIDRFIQRFPTYEVAEGILESILDLFFENKIGLISSSISEMKEFKLVNIRHKSLQKQNVLVVQLENIDNVINITLITIYKANTSFVNDNPDEFTHLHKKPKFFSVGMVGKKLQKYAKNNEIPDELKCITKLWD